MADNHSLPSLPSIPEYIAYDLAHDIEVYVAGQAAQLRGPEVTPLIEKAHELAVRAYGEDWLHWGFSGLPLAGEQIAGHAEATIEVLRVIGWNPSDSARRSIRDGLFLARSTEAGWGDDTSWRIGDLLNILIRASTGAPSAFYESWDMHPSRIVGDVYAILAAAAAYARRYGLADAVQLRG
ncbi:hypothetical protein [Streptomyces scopuliridis]|uniref:hypothetical protein n=1 Tax=Streptomyces scopuliridis TaxID=452529 RepID=UPI00368CDDEC